MVPSNFSEKRILDSWKGIAAYLERSEKTCRRWEHELCLPIHRLEKSPKARVFAYKDELDKWVKEKYRELDNFDKKILSSSPDRKTEEINQDIPLGFNKGDSFGSRYQILEKLGEGGMGVVYKAEDTKHKCTVALKFLPPEMTRDSEAKKRFIQEAQAASALDHPYIGTIYEIDETEDRQLFIAMACYKGETLKQKIERGPLKIKEAIELAIQVAEGLAKAHLQGIIHRDIKPANVMVTEEGRVKILDFGLAKLQGQSQFTRAGTTLGTVAYMSPEQLRSEAVDLRTDIWSLGVLLYEMVTGQFPFKGEYEQAVTYSILNEEPEPLTGLRNRVPMELERIVSKATAKEPAKRYQHVDELPVDLKNVDLTSTGTSQTSTSANGMHEMKKPKFWERNVVWQVIAILSIIAVVAVWYLKPIPSEVTKFTLNYDTDFSNSFFTGCPIISPDGKKILYAVNGSLYLRRSDEMERRLLPGTEGASSPFFKPDGRSIGFIANNELKTMRLGAKPKPLTGMEHKTFNFYSWGYNNYIYYSRSGTWDIWRISEDGGAPENLSTPDKEKGEYAHWFPEILPDGKSLLFTIWKNDLNNTQVALLDIATKEYKVLIEGGSHARYVPTGHIVYAQSGVLMAAPFDTKNYKLGEQREPIIISIRQEIITGQTFLSFSNTGLLIYLRGGIWTLRHQVVLVDRFGNEKITGITPGAIFSPRFSPDETKIAFTKFENGLLNIFTYDIEGETEEQITSGYNNLYGDWTPDGSKITYTTFRKGPYDIYQLSVNPRGNEEPLLTGKTDQIFRTWSPDGKIFLFGEYHPISGANIRYYDTNNKNSTKSLLSEEYLEFNPSFSPDGKWLVYASNEFGQNEIFIRRFSVSGKGTPISLGGGNEPVWSKDGNEVYYKSKNKMMGVKIETKPQLTFSKPTILFEFERPFYLEGGINYDVSKDGKFLMVRNEQGKSVETVVIQNWFEELKDKFKSGNK